MFLFKKMIGPLLYPLSLCMVLLIIGLIMLLFTKRQRAGKAVLSIGVILLMAFSYHGLPEYVLKPLEYRYPPLLNAETASGTKWVVVFGGGGSYDPKRPATAQLASASLLRLAEGIRVHKALAGSKLVLSGGAVFSPVSEALLMANAALALGVEKNSIILESESNDTENQAMLIKKITGNEPFVLVTTASHMPRSMALCQKLAMQPIPAPTDYLVAEEPTGLRPRAFFPEINHLEMAERAFHEYMGLAWARIMGRI